MKRFLLPFLLLALVRCSDTESLDQVERSAITEVVQYTFDGLAAHDSTMLSAVVLPKANFQRWASDSAGVWRTVNLSGASFTSRLGQAGPTYLERFWNADILVDEDVAIFSAPYDFWVEQTCSHCGYDVITLLRTEAEDSDFRGWRIASLTYTVDASGEEACRKRFPAMPNSPFSSD